MSTDEYERKWEATQRIAAAIARRNAAASLLAAKMRETSIAVRRFVRAEQRRQDEALFTHPDVQEMDLHDAAWRPDQESP